MAKRRGRKKLTVVGPHLGHKGMHKGHKGRKGGHRRKKA
jgi:hypothetical protein